MIDIEVKCNLQNCVILPRHRILRHVEHQSMPGKFRSKREEMKGNMNMGFNLPTCLQNWKPYKSWKHFMWTRSWKCSKWNPKIAKGALQWRNRLCRSLKRDFQDINRTKYNKRDVSSVPVTIASCGINFVTTEKAGKGAGIERIKGTWAEKRIIKLPKENISILLQMMLVKQN